MNQNNIYFDISPRRSGKTTRLKNAIISYLFENQNHTVSIVSHSFFYAMNIKRSIYDENPHLRTRIRCVNDNSISIRIMKHNTHEYDLNHMIFFDESDLIQYKFLEERCYYCTTNVDDSTLSMLSSVPNSIIIQPTNLNNFENTQHSDCMDNWINIASTELSDTINNEIYEKICDNREFSNIMEDNGTINVHNDTTEEYELDDNEDNYPDLNDTTEENYFLERIGIL